MQRIKVVVSGAFDAGKTQLIKTVSEIAAVTTERRVTDETRAIKPTTTAAMDYGRVTLPSGAQMHLYGTPGQRRFDFMWTALARGMRGLILVVDSTRPDSFPEARFIIQFFATLVTVPVVVAANKQDIAGALTPAELHAALELPPGTPVLPCIATDAASIRDVLVQLVALLPATAASVPEPLPTPQVVPPSRPSLPPIRPIAPAPLAVAALHSRGRRQRKAHLTRGDGVTLCGRRLGAEAVPMTIFGADDCRACDRRARLLGLACTDCGRPLTRSNGEGICLGCARNRAWGDRDEHLALDAWDERVAAS